MPDPRVEILDKTVCYDGFFRIERYRLRHHLYRGGWSREISRELFERGHAAAVLPYDPVRDEVVLVEQFRIGALGAPGDPWLMEIVAGIIDKPEESPEAVARREAVEEANCHLQELVHICEYFVSPGGTSERISLFCGKVNATGLGGIHGLAEEVEDIRVLVLPMAEAIAQLQAGHIRSAAPIIALQWLQLNHQSLRARWGTQA
ncbi:MAG: NUDIX domain-containing protein [Candidatus Tectomicrobia bacterium]|uniref:ADP-ribose pyrophosphatase n=1 Tax=Tectimicrobiota bacterium TaxID=2528274 RepID=A0A937W6F9_UNCTE|nr:NUDIX domain-containing protein [Candidatus Tectomicrobia bacterium]